MQKIYFKIGLILLLLMSSGIIYAQDETEEELPEIPYYQASSNFNVPILQLEGWENQSSRDDAIFINESLNARLHVTAVRTLDDDEAIETALSSLYEGDLSEPILESRIGVSNGTWTQQLFTEGDTSISSLALVRGDRTFVMTLIEDSPDYTAHYLAVRTIYVATAEATEPRRDFESTVVSAVEAYLGEGTEFELVDSSSPTSGILSVENLYSIESGALTAFAEEFDDITYTTFVNTETDTAFELGIATTNLFLGFFITPDNSNYLYLALGMVALIFAILIGSMWFRYQNVKKDMALVEELSKKD